VLVLLNFLRSWRLAQGYDEGLLFDDSRSWRLAQRYAEGSPLN
jgi:hypothetical protein